MEKAFRSPDRKKRKWISYTYYGCHNDQIVMVVMRCPLVDGIALVNLSWQHKLVPQ